MYRERHTNGKEETERERCRKRRVAMLPTQESCDIFTRTHTILQLCQRTPAHYSRKIESENYYNNSSCIREHLSRSVIVFTPFHCHSPFQNINLRTLQFCYHTHFCLFFTHTLYKYLCIIVILRIIITAGDNINCKQNMWRAHSRNSDNVKILF